jgi:hypothetical protein
MPTECSPALFDFAPVAGRAVVAGFDGGAITSDAGALLLGAADRATGLVRRFAACFRDAQAPARVEHEIATLVGQRVFGIALGTRTWSTTTGCGTTRCWPCSPASWRRGARAARRWPARAP